MKRLALVLVVALLAPVALASPAVARGEACVAVRAIGVGRGAPPEAGDPPDLVRTEAHIFGAGPLTGRTEVALVLTEPTPTGFAFAGEITFLPRRHGRRDGTTLTVTVRGTLDLSTGEFRASGPVSAATGRLAGASGEITFVGVQDPDGRFIEVLYGQLCFDDD